jgi:hypothetical protein
MEQQSGVEVSPPLLLDSEVWTSVPERSESETGWPLDGISAALSLQVIARRELVGTRVRWSVRTARAGAVLGLAVVRSDRLRRSRDRHHDRG